MHRLEQINTSKLMTIAPIDKETIVAVLIILKR